MAGERARFGEFVGKRQSKAGASPTPYRLRHPFVPRVLGGAYGYRGRNWAKIREAVLARDKHRSTVSGMDAIQGGGLQVDHINPFRLGGKNRMSNLRTTDSSNNFATDSMHGAREKKPRRDHKW